MANVIAFFKQRLAGIARAPARDAAAPARDAAAPESSGGARCRPRPQPDRVITVRRVRPQFDTIETVLWFRGDRFRTDLFNAYTLLLADEHEFVRIMREYLPTVHDEGLRKQLKAWLGQEMSHGVQHIEARRYIDRLGLRHHAYHAVAHFLYFRLIFPALSSQQRLAFVAGLEHFNTLLGETCLRDAEYFSGAEDELSLLLRWHFAEEIEHRAVVHDVADAAGVDYFTRVATGALALTLSSATLFATAFWLAAQTGNVFRPTFYRSLFRFLCVDECYAQLFVSYLRDYLSPDFHPLDRDSDGFADRALSQVTVATGAGFRLAQTPTT
jgi:predicted metal-dependent hydrolase